MFGFYALLYKGEFHSARSLITPQFVQQEAKKIVVEVCACGPDDPDLLLKPCIDCGASMNPPQESSSALHSSAYHNKPKLMRCLLDWGIPVNIPSQLEKRTPLQWAFDNNSIAAMQVLIDAGAKIIIDETLKDQMKYSTIKTHIVQVASQFAKTRNQVRTIAMLCLLQPKRLKNRQRDVMRIIARSIWATRGYDAWIKNF